MAAPLLKVYADRLSQPSRALIIFCRANKIEFEEVTVSLGKAQHRTPEFKKINPMGQVPAIVDGRFRLFERQPCHLEVSRHGLPWGSGPLKIAKEVASQMEIPKHGVATLTMGEHHYTKGEYDTVADGRIYFKEGWKKFVRRADLQIAQDVLITFHSKANQRRLTVVFDVL